MGVEKTGTWLLSEWLLMHTQGEQEKGGRVGHLSKWGGVSRYTHALKNTSVEIRRESAQMTQAREKGLRTVWPIQVERWELNGEQLEAVEQRPGHRAEHHRQRDQESVYKARTTGVLCLGTGSRGSLAGGGSRRWVWARTRRAGLPSVELISVPTMIRSHWMV